MTNANNAQKSPNGDLIASLLRLYEIRSRIHSIDIEWNELLAESAQIERAIAEENPIPWESLCSIPQLLEKGVIVAVGNPENKDRDLVTFEHIMELD